MRVIAASYSAVRIQWHTSARTQQHRNSQEEEQKERHEVSILADFAMQRQRG